MRVLLSAVGTRGDVQPALAFALELRHLGHSVRLCVPPNFVAWAERLGLEAVSMGVEMRAQGSVSAPDLTSDELRRLRESLPDLVADQFETLGAAADRCDVIVGTNAHQYAAPSVAEHRGIDHVAVVYAPVAVPSLDHAPPPVPGQTEAGATEPSIEQQWRDTARLWNERALDRINRHRLRFGLRPIDDVLDHVLSDSPWLAADEALAPMPVTPGRKVFQCGAWLLADRTTLPSKLQAFLRSGRPPVFIGFGSMPVEAEVYRCLIDAARVLGCRIIVSRGWGAAGPIDEAPDCIAVQDLNHELLFPQVAAVVHHGGAGTTAAAARAGAAQLVMPMFGDQFYWASRVAKLGVGATLSPAAATRDSSLRALQIALCPALQTKARLFADQVRCDGAAVAARRLAARSAGQCE